MEIANNMTLPPQSFIKDTKDIVVEGFTLFNKDFQTFLTKYNFALIDYLNAKLHLLSKMKLAFFTSQVVNFNEIYVPQDLQIQYDVINQKEFLDKLREKKRFIISATAGAGKSCMMKNIFLNLNKENKTKITSKSITLFYELRRINDKQKSIIDSLVDDIAEYNNKFNKENLEYILKYKETFLLLDGFDELHHNEQRRYLSEINEISERYTNLHIVISSRPQEDLFTNLTLFDVANVKDIDLEKSKQIIRNLNYKMTYDELSERFINALETKLFKTHRSFISNPLLLTIMFVTYEECGEIPNKQHLFYKKAFEAIFHKHDIYKGGFLRKRYIDLDEEQFQKVFSMFCAGTYIKSEYSFNKDFLNKALEKCLLRYEFNNISVENLLQELLVNTPLLIQDSMEYTFVHRSFQEYFTAIYIVNNQSDTDILIRILEKYQTDNVLKMAYDLNSEFIENKLILPIIDDYIAGLEKNKQKYDNNEYAIFISFFPKIKGTHAFPHNILKILCLLDINETYYIKTLTSFKNAVLFSTRVRRIIPSRIVMTQFDFHFFIKKYKNIDLNKVVDNINYLHSEINKKKQHAQKIERDIFDDL